MSTNRRVLTDRHDVVSGAHTFKFAGLSHNAYYRIYKGHYTISKKGKAFRTLVKTDLKGLEPMEQECGLHIVFRFADRRKRDLDNYQKALIDALKGLVFKDDSQIIKLVTEKQCGAEKNEMFVCWYPL